MQCYSALFTEKLVLQAKAEQRASQLQDTWLAHKQELTEMKQSLK